MKQPLWGPDRFPEDKTAHAKRVGKSGIEARNSSRMRYFDRRQGFALGADEPAGNTTRNNIQTRWLAESSVPSREGRRRSREARKEMGCRAAKRRNERREAVIYIQLGRGLLEVGVAAVRLGWGCPNKRTTSPATLARMLKCPLPTSSPVH